MHDRDEFEEWKKLDSLPRNHPLAIDPIQYWLTQKRAYPTLSCMALDILSILAGAADCKRSFSEVGYLLGTRRLTMNTDLLSALQCLRSWKRIGPQPAREAPKGGFTIGQIDEICGDLSDWSD